MDAKLAEMYGIGTVSDTDLDKLAAAEMAEALASEEGLDLSQLSAEEIEALAREVLGAGEKTASEEETQEQTEETQEQTEETEEQTEETEEVDPETVEKVAEAEWLGRLMAHALWNEAEELAEKTAGVSKAAKDTVKGRIGSFFRGTGQKAKEVGGKAMDHVKANKGAYGAGAGGLAVGGAVGAGLAKKSSAVDTLAEQRALEILAEAGIELQTEEKVAADEDAAEALAQAVEARAWELLAEAGYVQSDEE